MSKIFKLPLKLLPFAVFFILLYFNSLAKEGTLRGLLLWFNNVLPTLFPFMIVTSFIMETEAYRPLIYLLSKPVSLLFGISGNAAYPILVGFLCGFPMGSKITADMVKKGNLTVTEGNILLSFCNNVSPPFILYFILNYTLKIVGIHVKKYLLVMFLSPFITGVIMSKIILHKSLSLKTNNPISYNTVKSENDISIIDKCILGSALSQIKLCGYIIIFSILCCFIRQYIHNYYICCILVGTLEITTGLNMICNLPFSFYKLALALCISSFGGICTLFQTYSMIKNSNLNIGIYLLGKLLNTLITFLLILVLYI